MIVHIRSVLSPSQVATAREQLSRADWRDGRLTAGPQSARVKANLQVAETCPVARDVGQMIVGEIERHPLFLSAALPRHLYPPLFNRYESGMHFGSHIDNAIRQIPGTPYRIRTDMSATLFLADPEDYDGGELVIGDAQTANRVKLPAGDMVLYPADTLHHVTAVSRGARLAAFFWVQSLVKDQGQRTLLHEMDTAIRELAETAPDAPALLRLAGCYHNLVRRWSEM